MFLLDTLFIGGIKFVLGKIAEAVDSELNDESRLREELLAAQMRLELGEISQDDFAALETAILARLREIRLAQMAEAASPRDFKVTGIEATTWDDDGAGTGERGDGRGGSRT